jgi:hypothetical protein
MWLPFDWLSFVHKFGTNGNDIYIYIYIYMDDLQLIYNNFFIIPPWIPFHPMEVKRQSLFHVLENPKGAWKLE